MISWHTTILMSYGFINSQDKMCKFRTSIHRTRWLTRLRTAWSSSESPWYLHKLIGDYSCAVSLLQAHICLVARFPLRFCSSFLYISPSSDTPGFAVFLSLTRSVSLCLVLVTAPCILRLFLRIDAHCEWPHCIAEFLWFSLFWLLCVTTLELT